MADLNHALAVEPRDYLALDQLAAMLQERSQHYMKNPPPSAWDGVEVMTHK